MFFQKKLFPYLLEFGQNNMNVFLNFGFITSNNIKSL